MELQINFQINNQKKKEGRFYVRMEPTSTTDFHSLHTRRHRTKSNKSKNEKIALKNLTSKLFQFEYASTGVCGVSSSIFSTTQHQHQPIHQTFAYLLVLFLSQNRLAVVEHSLDYSNLLETWLLVVCPARYCVANAHN